MIPAQKIMKALSYATALLAVSATMGSSHPAFAQDHTFTPHPVMRSSGPEFPSARSSTKPSLPTPLFGSA